MQGVTGLNSIVNNSQQGMKLTEEQNQKLTNFLSNYNSDNLSDGDAKEIISQIKELGITPGSGLASVLTEAGMDVKGLAEQAGIGGPSGAGGPPPGGPPPGGPPPGANGRDSVDDTLVSLIEDAAQSYEESDDAESIWSILEPTLQEAGYDTSQPVIDFYS